MNQKKINRQKGTALISVLMVTMIAAGLSATYVLRSVQTSRATRCNLNGEKALNIAEAGLDLAINNLTSGGSGVVSGQIGGGTYSVQAASSWTGLYTLTSTAAYDGITRSIEATVAILAETGPFSPPSAITILNQPGRLGLNANFSGNAFGINGRDTNINGSAGPSAAVYGIGVLDNTSVANILASLQQNGVQSNNIVGTGANPSVANVSTFCELDLAKAMNFADQMQLAAKLTLPRPGEGVTFTYKENNASFGTTASPQVTFVRGNLQVAGNSSGAGILVVNGDFSVVGNFEFNGLVLVTGLSYLKFDSSFKGNVKVHGSVIICNPTPATPFQNENLDLRGNVDVWYSSEGLNIAKQAMGNFKQATLISWRRTR